MTAPHVTELRQQLMDTLTALRDREHPMEPDRARAIAQVAGVLVDSAKVEVEYLRVTGQNRAGFLEDAQPALPASKTGSEVSAHNPFPRVTRHRLEG